MGELQDVDLFAYLAEALFKLGSVRVVLDDLKTLAVAEPAHLVCIAHRVATADRHADIADVVLVDHQYSRRRTQTRSEVGQEPGPILFANMRPPEMRHSNLELGG